MANLEELSLRTQFEALSKDAVVEILLPRSPDNEISGFLSIGLPEEISSIASRRNLFFGIVPLHTQID